MAFRLFFVFFANKINKLYGKTLGATQKEDAEGESLNKCSEYYLFL